MTGFRLVLEVIQLLINKLLDLKSDMLYMKGYMQARDDIKIKSLEKYLDETIIKINVLIQEERKGNA